MKLFIKLALLVSIPTIGIILFLYYNLNNQLISDIKKNAIINKQKDIDKLYNEYSLIINNTKNTINLASIGEKDKFTKKSLHNKIIRYFKAINNLTSVTYISTNGIEIIGVNKQRLMLSTKDKFYFNSKIFQIPMLQDNSYISKIYKDSSSDLLLIDISKKVSDIKTGQTLGVVLLTFSLYDFQKSISDKLLDYMGLTIIDKNDKHIIYQSEKMKKVNLNNFTQTQKESLNFKDFLLLKKEYTKDNISFVIMLNNKTLFNSKNQIIVENMLLLISMLIIVFILISIIIKKVLEPIDLLINDIRYRLSSNNKNSNIHSKNEIDRLQKYFKIYEKALHIEKNKLEDLNSHLNEKINEEVEKNRQKDLKLNQQAKMVALGEMIGNIAHQWRQPLSTISTTASGMKIKSEFDTLSKEEINEFTNSIVNQTNYLSETINTFKNFLNVNKDEDLFSVQEAVNSSLNILNASINNYNINIIKNLQEENETKTYMILGELEEVIINIVNNAKDALVSNKIIDPWIKLEIQNKQDKILLTIEDNAKGIPDDIIDRIFEPYFTTKHKSKGTGLGLHMSFKIITESFNGDLYVKNTLNGAKFHIEIPLLN